MRSPRSAPVREGARGIDGDDADGPPASRTCPTSAPMRVDFPTPGRPGDPDDRRAARVRVDLADERVRERIAVLDERDRTGERATIAGAHAGDELLERQLLPRHAGTLCRASTGPSNRNHAAAKAAAFRDLRATGIRASADSGLARGAASLRHRAAPRSPRGASRSARAAVCARPCPFSASRSACCACPLASAATADSELASTASHSLPWATGSQRVMHERDERGDEIDDARADPYRARADHVGEHARRCHREPERPRSSSS